METEIQTQKIEIKQEPPSWRDYWSRNSLDVAVLLAIIYLGKIIIEWIFN
jgi:hypothetical protein